MDHKFIRLVVGDPDQKRAWRSRRKRANALPPDYRYTCKQIMKYSVNFGFPEIFETDLLDFFEQSAAAGRPAREVVGRDAAAFCDELLGLHGSWRRQAAQTLNAEIQAQFAGKGESPC